MIFAHKTKGLFIKVCEIRIPQLKSNGIALKSIEDSSLICVSDDFFKNKFKEVKDITINKLE
jgi:hypothetical protein